MFRRKIDLGNRPLVGALASEDYQKIVDYTKAYVAFRDEVAVTVADIARGRGYFLTRNIILPEWIREYDRCYQIYYAVHELCHCMMGPEHNKPFKKVEDILLDLWDIKIMWMRVYPKKLFLDGREIVNIPYNRKYQLEEVDAASKTAA